MYLRDVGWVIERMKDIIININFFIHAKHIQNKIFFYSCQLEVMNPGLSGTSQGHESSEDSVHLSTHLVQQTTTQLSMCMSTTSLPQ